MSYLFVAEKEKEKKIKTKKKKRGGPDAMWDSKAGRALGGQGSCRASPTVGATRPPPGLLSSLSRKCLFSQ